MYQENSTQQKYIWNAKSQNDCPNWWRKETIVQEDANRGYLLLQISFLKSLLKNKNKKNKKPLSLCYLKSGMSGYKSNTWKRSCAWVNFKDKTRRWTSTIKHLKIYMQEAACYWAWQGPERLNSEQHYSCQSQLIGPRRLQGLIMA